MAVKKPAKKKAVKRPSGKRDTIKVGTKAMYAKRTSRGRFQEMDGTARSLKADRRVAAKTEIQSGFGDQGDRRAR
jgi:hypothetical protein